MERKMKGLTNEEKQKRYDEFISNFFNKVNDVKKDVMFRELETSNDDFAFRSYFVDWVENCGNQSTDIFAIAYALYKAAYDENIMSKMK